MNYSFTLSLALVLCVTACSKQDDSVVVPPPPNPADNSATVAAPANLGAPAATSPEAPPSTPPPTGLTAPAGTGSKDEYNGEVVTRDDNGNRLDGEAFLKRAMMQHVEGKGHPYPERIEELVEKGTIKSLPPAPNGQKWFIDPATRQIVLK